MEAEKNNNNEIDLIDLLKSLRKGLKSIFNSITELLINSLLFILKQFNFLFKTIWKYKITAILFITISTASGIYISKHVKDIYFDELIVKTNTEFINYQLYKNIEEYNLLIENQNLEELSSILKIDTTVLHKIISIEIYPDVNLVHQNKLISKILNSRDTSLKESVNIEEIKLNINPQLYPNQIINIKSNEQLDFSVFENAIINHIESSSNILKEQNKKIEELKANIINNQLFINDLDTLKNIYENEIISDNNLKNLNQKSGSNNIDATTLLLLNNFEGNKNTEKLHLDVLERKNKLIRQSSDLQNKLYETKYFISVISTFNRLGKIDENHLNNNLPSSTFKASLLFVIISSLVLSILKQIKHLL